MYALRIRKFSKEQNVEVTRREVSHPEPVAQMINGGQGEFIQCGPLLKKRGGTC